MLAPPFPIAEPPLNAVRFTPRAAARLVALGVTGAHDVTIDKVTAGKPRPRPRHGERPHRRRGLCPVENFQFSREPRSRHLIPEVQQAVCPQPGRPWTKSLRGLCPVENFQFSREPRSRHLIPEVQQAVCPQPAIRLMQGGRFLAKRRWSRSRWFPHLSHGEPHLSHAEAHGPGEHDRRSGESGDRQHLRPAGDAFARRDHHECRRTCRRHDGNGCPRSEHVWLFRHFHGSPMKRTPSSGPIKWPPPHASARMSTSSWPWKKSSGRFSTDENLRFSRVLRTRHVIPDVQQAVYPQPARSRCTVRAGSQCTGRAGSRASGAGQTCTDTTHRNDDFSPQGPKRDRRTGGNLKDTARGTRLTRPSAAIPGACRSGSK